MEDRDASKSMSNKIDIIRTVKTPLGFFTLVVLVVEVILGITANFSEGSDRSYLILGMLFLIFLLVVIVALFAFFRPEALSGGRPQVDSAFLGKKAIEYGIKIKSPKEGTTVSEIVEVSGTYQIKPPDGSLRIFLVSNVNERRTWPHAIVTNFDSEKKKWFCSIRIGGGPYTSYIVAAIVEGAGQVLWDYYFQVSSKTLLEPIQSPLSSYATECHRVKIERVE